MASKETLGRIRHLGLVTQQRRLRHLHSISARNIVPKFPLFGDSLVDHLLETYFTLHNFDGDPEAFYTSEKIIYSLNPTWSSFELNTVTDWSQSSSTLFMVRLWGGHGNKYSLIIEWKVDLTILQYLGDQIRTSSHPPNTLIFGLVDGYYGATFNHTISKTAYKPQQIYNSSLKVDTEQLVPSYSKASLQRLQSLQRAIRQTQLSVLEYQQTIENSLVTTEKSMLQLAKRESLKLKLKLLREELASKNAIFKKEIEEEKKMLHGIRKREQNLAKKRKEFEDKNILLREHKQAHINKRESLVKLNAQLNMRKRQLACELVYIYPIVQDDKNFLICGVHLPNSESDEFFATDDDTLSCSLGYACHLVYMISKILEVPIRYAMNPMGSRSTIMDFTIEKVADKDKEFPLHTKGKEKIQFYYGIFLLNKNIAQLRQYCNLSTPNLRNTLPNIKDTLETKFSASTEPIKTTMSELYSLKTSQELPIKPKIDRTPATSIPNKKPPLMPKPGQLPSKPSANSNQSTSSSSSSSNPTKPPLPPKPHNMRQGTQQKTLSDRENELLNVVNYDFANESTPAQASLPGHSLETISPSIENETVKNSLESGIKPAAQGAPHKFFERSRRSSKKGKSFSTADGLSQITETKNEDSWTKKRKSLNDLRSVPVEVMRERATVNKLGSKPITESGSQPLTGAASNIQESKFTEQSTDSRKPSLPLQSLGNGIDGGASKENPNLS